ncbi:MAG: hypothetical protein GON13_00090 [Nanoarchaeota archaeon]|nr:hypothetical protein [Nanoarchaeota archaeon]
MDDLKFKQITELTVKEINDSPIRSFKILPGTKFGLFEIHPTGIFPTSSSILDRKSFLNRLQTKIKEKISLNQREDGHVNILIVKANHWTLHNYSMIGGLADYEFEEIEPIVNSTLSENTPSKNLSAIILFEGDLGRRRIIKNSETEVPLPNGIF